MRLQGKVALVTGAGGGIGRAIAVGFAREGAIIVVNDIDEAVAAATADEVEKAGTKGLICCGDISNAEAVDEIFGKIDASYGQLDIMANVAGIYPRTTVVDMSYAEWDRVIAVNLRGVFLCSQAAARRMIPRRSGAILSIVSGLGLSGASGGAHYAASKAGIMGLTKSLAKEVAEFGVTVNAISPGPTDTPMIRGNRSDAEIGRSAAKNIWGRLFRPDEVVPTAIYLCSDEAKSLSGRVWLLGS